MITVKKDIQEKLFKGVLRLNANMLGLTLGLVIGLLIFIMTNWLVMKGGYVTPEGKYVIGPNLQLLSQFFIGYKVSFWGSIIGFGYGFAFGTICGAALGLIYNKLVDIRNRHSSRVEDGQ